MKQSHSEVQLPRQVQDKFEEEIRIELIRQQTELDLKSNPVYQEFFGQFNPASVESFIRNYSRRKAIYMTTGPQYLNQQEQGALKYKILAEEALWAIQQKKLFNLQCQWRAEQIKLKGVEHSTQFLLFAANIQHCPFISPVSRAELDLYIQFLRTGYGRPQYGYDNWQDYEAFKAEYETEYDAESSMEDETMPAWYRFYDEHMGTRRLFELPDIRGEKENRYRSIARQRQLETLRRQQKNTNTDPRPFLSIFDQQVVESFIKKFEDKRMLKYCRAVEEFQDYMDNQIELEDAIETLRTATVDVPVRNSRDWKTALIQAARQFELEQIAGMLPSVHQEYLFRVENGINFPQSLADKKKEEYAFQLCDMARTQIIDGRGILGEPQNLKF